jgi:hypothetical protein
MRALALGHRWLFASLVSSTFSFHHQLHRPRAQRRRQYPSQRAQLVDYSEPHVFARLRFQFDPLLLPRVVKKQCVLAGDKLHCLALAEHQRCDLLPIELENDLPLLNIFGRGAADRELSATFHVASLRENGKRSHRKRCASFDRRRRREEAKAISR